jgi:hypothetical protein
LFQQHADVSLDTGQVYDEAVSSAEPAGKHIALSSRVSVRPTLFDAPVHLTVMAEQILAGVPVKMDALARKVHSCRRFLARRTHPRAPQTNAPPSGITP